MAVSRQQNFLGNSRVDVPFLRAVESAVCRDFDVLSGIIIAGKKPIVISGFKIISNGISNAEDLELQVANSSLIHYYASDSGSIFTVASNVSNEVLTSTNNNVSGGFAPNQVNYVGLDLIRSIDDTTSDLVAFIDSDNLTQAPDDVPLARTLSYKIIISTIDFNSLSTVLPIAKVTTDATNAIVSIEDARNLLGRLGSGGTTPNSGNFYSWPTGRDESTYSDSFLGGDKSIDSLKSWMDAVMSRIWEVGGGEYWYSTSTDKNVKLVTQGSQFSNGEWFEWVSSNLHWKGLVFLFDNSTGYKNEVVDQTTNVSGLTNLADGDCLYVDIDRTQNLTGGSGLVAAKAPLTSVGAGAVPGSRYILAWRFGSNVYTRFQTFPVGGGSFPAATVSSNGAVSISATPNNVAQPFAVLENTANEQAISGGVSRGDVADGYNGGSGDLLIGGGTEDTNVVLSNVNAAGKILARGAQTTGKTPTFQIDNETAVTNSNENIALKVTGKVSGSQETAFQVEGNGAIGLRPAPTTIAIPNPSGSDKIELKIYLINNGLASPNKKNQLIILDEDGSETMFWEGLAH